MSENNNNTMSSMLDSLEILAESPDDGKIVLAFGDLPQKLDTWLDNAESTLSEVDETLGDLTELREDMARAVEAAGDAKDDAETQAANAEAWAVGTRGGTDVSTEDETYHNNSKYYAEQTSTGVSAAAASASAAATSAGAAAGSASDAASSANESAVSAAAASASATAASSSQTSAASSATAAAASQAAASTSATSASNSAASASSSATSASGSATAAAASASAAAQSAQDAEDVLDSIPPDYTTTVQEVTELKSAIEQTSQILTPYDHVTGKYVNESGEVTSNNFEYFAYEIPSYCSQIKFATNIYGPSRIVLSTVSNPNNFATNPYATYPASSYESPTDYSNTVNCDGYKYIFVPHYVGDAKAVIVNTFLSNRLDIMGQNVSTLEGNQPGLMTGNNIDITNGKYVSYLSGNIGTIDEAGATGAIPVVSGVTYVLTLASSIRTDSRGIAFYKDGGFITGSGIQYIKGTTVYSFTVPDGANQVRLTVMLKDAAQGYFTLKAVTNLKTLTEFVNKAVDYKIPESIENVFSFNTVGIVGDSLASGCSNYKDDQDVWHALDRKAFAWGKFLEKRQGCSVTLFSQGGMNTRTWFTNANGYAKAINNPCECYFIGLGVNDFASLKAAYLGTIADVHVGSEDNNGDTFYGNYSKIIAKLTEIQPRCKIFCITMPGNQGASQTKLDYDTAIRTVTALYNNAYLLDLTNDSFFVSSPLTDTWYGAHYLSTGYSLIADHMLDVANKYMLDHLDDFADIQWITNNWPNTDIVN